MEKVFVGLMLSAALLVSNSDARAAGVLNPKLEAHVAKMKQNPERAKETVRVIVSLDRGEYADRDKLQAALSSRDGRRASYLEFVKAVEADFRRSLQKRFEARVVRAYQSIPGMVMDLTAAQIEELTQHPMIEAMDPVEVYEKFDAESHPLTGVDLAQSAGFTGAGITVAVIDDGIQADHPAFGGTAGFPTTKIVGGFDFADNDADPRNDCNAQDHGTNVSGMLAGAGGGITGVAPDANLVFLKIQSAGICGQSSLDGDLVGAIDWVATNQSLYDISILSMSLGGGSFSSVSTCEASSTALTNALNAAEAAGIVTFAASGNSGTCNNLARPACVGSVISVGAVYDADVGNPGFCVDSSACTSGRISFPSCPTGFAGFEGSTSADKVTLYTNSASFLDLLAPANCATTADTGSGTNTCFGGTSAATPFAAGVGALALEAAGGSLSLDRSQMLDALALNGTSVTDVRNGRTTPRVDADATVTALSSPPLSDLATYDFDSGTDGWSNPDGNYGWRRRSGTTPSNNTGPSAGFGGAGSYWYLETSRNQGPHRSGDPDAVLNSPALPTGSDREVEFAYHMYGSRMGRLSVDVSTDGGSSWVNVWSIAGQQQSSSSAAWSTVTLDLSGYSGSLMIRFRGTSTAPSNGWWSDMAVDQVVIRGR